MSYQGTVLQCLISSPGDVPRDDLAIVRLEINRWNGAYGRSFGTAITPISWGTNAAAEFGQPPQDILNRQIVDQCDMCIAIFAARLGTPTKNAVSGTAEEIERLRVAGKYVAVLRSERGVRPSATDPDQLKELERYLAKLSENGLLMTYSTEAELATNVQMIMASAAMRDHTRSVAELDRAGYADVWPRVEHEDRLLSGGRLYRNWFLALANVGSAPARDVHINTEPTREGEDAWEPATDADEGEPDVDVLGPGGDIRFPVAATLAHSPQVRCRVTWTDDRGEQTNTATLRLA